KTVEDIAQENVKALPQDESKAIHHAPKIFKETCEIDWNKSAESIHNLVRGLSPYPAAWTKFDDKICKIFKTNYFPDQKINRSIGQLETDNKSYLKVQTGAGVIEILELQLEGKKRMKVDDLLRGY